MARPLWRRSLPAFGTTPLPLSDWLICVRLASLVLWDDEAKKLLER